jgi:hypothetical protein
MISPLSIILLLSSYQYTQHQSITLNISPVAIAMMLSKNIGRCAITVMLLLQLVSADVLVNNLVVDDEAAAVVDGTRQVR